MITLFNFKGALLAMSRNFLCVNPKSYLHGKELYEFAIYLDKLAKMYNFDIYLTSPTLYLISLKKICGTIKITSQEINVNFSYIDMGGMNTFWLKEIGIQAIVLNHASNPMSRADLTMAIQMCKEYKLESIVCVDDYEEIDFVSKLKPDIMVCEQHKLIGKGKVSDNYYMKKSNEIIKSNSPLTKISQSAGIRSKFDIINAFKNGADGTGITSGIFCAKNPSEKLIEFLEATKMAIDKYGG